MYTVEFTEKALEYIKKQPQKEQETLLKKIHSIRENPQTHLKKLKGTKLWRLRVGKQRAIIDLIIKNKTLYVITIGKRKNIYSSE